jgi:phosphoenolpyruvate carboxylase
MSISSSQVEVFKEEVLLKYQLFNSLFTSLPFHKIEKTGILLSLLVTYCDEGYAKGKSPKKSLNTFSKPRQIITAEKKN